MWKERDIREFLKRFTVKELKGRRLLSTGSYRGGHTAELLRAGSVKPLQDLMREHNVTRLVAEDRDWFLTHDGEFKNPKSEELKEGNVRDLENRGSVFTRQNPHINPFFKKESADVREFLKRFTVKELKGRRLLSTGSYRGGHTAELLRAGSVKPLQDLMREHNVTRLVAEDRDWFLTHDGEFKNPKSEELKEGNVRDLENRGSVFTRQNPHINPFFKKESAKESSGD